MQPRAAPDLAQYVLPQGCSTPLSEAAAAPSSCALESSIWCRSGLASQMFYNFRDIDIIPVDCANDVLSSTISGNLWIQMLHSGGGADTRIEASAEASASARGPPAVSTGECQPQ